MLQQAQKNQVIDIDALSMIDGVIEVAEMQVRDIMIPRSQMVVVERDAELNLILETVVDSAHSRFPAVGENRDEVVGILLAKDLLRYSVKKVSEQLSIRDVLRPAVFVPESKRLNVLLKEFRASRNHLAIVVDEYGGVAGMVTIEDVLEQIVGEIEDEHDIDEETFIRKYSDSNFTVKALTPIEDFNAYFGSEFSDEEFDTIGGFVTHKFGRLPRRGESIVLDNCSFQIVNAGNRRIHLMKVMLLRDQDAAHAAVDA